ncbi:MAG: response regulator [Bacteriovoracaceae bacterium]|nr:response regulator [Bacteroidota bacterium]
MFGNKSTSISSDQQREIISKHLRSADELVRAKNYDGALEEIRRALNIDPKHSLARSFQQRILLIQKQNAPIDDFKIKGPSQEEIMAMISQHFAVAEQMIAKRMYQDALKKIAEVYAVDPGNHFAKAYSDRIEQLILEQEQEGSKLFMEAIEHKKIEPVDDGIILPDRGSLEMYEELMKEVWFDGKVTPEEEVQLKEVRDIFAITDDEHHLVEKRVKSKAYIDALKLAWKDGVITEMERQVLDMMRRRYGITPEEHNEIEYMVQEAKKGTKPKARILLIEPDKTVLVTVMRALQLHNFEVIIASKVEDALQIMIKHIPKLIISETIFPAGAMDGFAFYKKIQEHPALKNTPIFFVTDIQRQNVLRAAMRMGFDLCLTKPIDTELLVAAIEGRLLLR